MPRTVKILAFVALAAVVALLIWGTIIRPPYRQSTVATPAPAPAATPHQVVLVIVIEQQCCPTATPKAATPAVTPKMVAPSACPPGDGVCWSYDHFHRTMTWTGFDSGGFADIHQGNTESLNAIRAGYEATLVTTITGTMVISVGEVDGIAITKPDQDIVLGPGRHVVKNSTGEAGGFRWSKTPWWRK